MFAQASWYLAYLENLEVMKLISQVIKDFASGEIKQESRLFDCKNYSRVTTRQPRWWLQAPKELPSSAL
ncbi:unnamed protein product [Arabis nemorensis]|uniref:Uncharacterized protein n=1 Tax=Arabis nemorensis TaxID=586526 RepID=A0A565BLA6_9BRAS|nr:unnamed protein product [Arabis nemorensis]